MTKEKLIIIGASGHGRVVADIARKIKKWEQISFLDDDETLKTPNLLGNSKEILNYVEDCDIFVAIGDNKIREKILQNLIKMGASIPTLIHPSAILGEDVKIGKGTVLMAGAIVNCNSTIGEGAIINTGAIIEHDNKIEDFVHISPGVKVAGAVSVGQRSWLGIGSVVINNIKISDDVQIGAGTVVVYSISEAGKYIGVPARRI